MRDPSRIAPVLPWPALVAAVRPAPAAEPLRDPAYAEEIGERTLDLYLHEGREGKPPLVAGFASRLGSQPADARGRGPALREPARRGP